MLRNTVDGCLNSYVGCVEEIYLRCDEGNLHFRVREPSGRIMDTTSKLVDIVIGLSKQGKRWPLLLIFLVPAYFVFFQNYYDIEFRQVFERRPFVWSATVTVILSILLYLILANYD